MATDTNIKAEQTFDPLDMNNYKVEKLPKMQKSKFEVWMARLGGPLAIIAFVWICWFCHIGFIDNLDTGTLAATAQKRLGVLGPRPRQGVNALRPADQQCLQIRPGGRRRKAGRRSGGISG